MPDEPPITQQAQGSYIAQATHGGTATVQVVLPPAPVQEQNRVRFLKRLRYRYDEEWEQSLEGAGLLTLGLVSKPDAVLHHTGLLFLSPQQPERPLPPGTSIAQVYEQAGQELLILGEPGAGKSTLLLDLARRLVECAEQDAAQPFPIILPLSTWVVKRQPLTGWLSEQLTQLYDVPRRLSYSWVQTDQLLLLLDGFDEVPQEARVACMKAIAAYREEHLVPIVVCSRRTEFEEIPRQQRLVMQSAVVVQPLTQEQVGAYLLQGGEAFSALRTVLHSNPVLAELVTTPLMLHMLTLTYTGSKVRDLPQGGSPEEQQRIIFASYVERMIERRRNHISFPLQRIIPWLSWLAQQMQQQNRAVFYMEQMQPDWLESGLLYRTYMCFAVRIPGILVGILVGLIVTSILFGFSSDPFGLSRAIQGFSLTSVILGILSGLFGGLFYGARSAKRPTQRATRWSGLSRILLQGGANGLVFGFCYALLYDGGSGYRSQYFLPDWLTMGGLCLGLCSILFILLIETRIRRSNQLRRTWAIAGHLVNGLITGILVGLCLALWLFIPQLPSLQQIIVRFSHSNLVAFVVDTELDSILIYALVFALVGTVLSAISEITGLTIQPAESIDWSWRTLGRSLLRGRHLGMAFLVGGCVGLFFWLNETVLRLLFALTKASGGIDAPNILPDFVLSPPDSWLIVGATAGVSYWVLIGLFRGVASKTLTQQQRVRANQGIRRSAHNSVVLGSSSGFLIALIAFLSTQGSWSTYIDLWNVDASLGIGWWSFFWHFWFLLAIAPSLVLGFAGGLLTGLLYGGLACIRHGVMRLLLWCSGSIPWHYVRFLDEAAGCILLHKVGGGYMFMHRLILDYFASLENPLTQPELPQALPPRVCSACGYQEEHPGARFCAGCGKSLAP